jgi:hypothetical protein
VIRQAGLVALGAGLAGLAFYAWQQYFSRDAEVRAIHAACRKEFADTGAKLRNGVDPGPRDAKPDAAAGSVTRSVGASLGRWLEGVTGGVSETVCGTIRDACATDFEGRVCRAARERYR